MPALPRWPSPESPTWPNTSPIAARIYDEALAADMRRLAKAHGEGPVRDALAMVGRRKPATQWDTVGHKRAAASGYSGCS